MKNKSDWWFRFFSHQDYLDIYHDMTGPRRTQTEINFCSRVLGWTAGNRILDAPCGAGRHVNELAKQGHFVTGLDISPYLLNLAMETSTVKTVPHFVRGLLQKIPFREASFDHAVCLFSSFGYGETEDENLTVMREFARVLKPGGKVLIDVMNRLFITPRLNRVHESIHSGLRVREERSIIDSGRRLHNQITVKDKDGSKRIYLYRPWLYNGDEISRMATNAGLIVDRVYGNFWADEYTKTSERAMLAAHKPTE